MPLIQIIVVLILIGILLWLEEAYIPMAPPLKLIIRVLVIFVVVIWILQLLFPEIFAGLGGLRVGGGR